MSEEGAPPNEIDNYISGRWLGSSEAAWRLMGFSISGIIPVVQRLGFELPGRQRIVFDPGIYDAATLADNEKLRKTQLTEWFRRNTKYKEALDQGRPAPFTLRDPYGSNQPVDPLQLLYYDVPLYYVWDLKIKT